MDKQGPMDEMATGVMIQGEAAAPRYGTASWMRKMIFC